MAGSTTGSAPLWVSEFLAAGLMVFGVRWFLKRRQCQARWTELDGVATWEQTYGKGRTCMTAGGDEVYLPKDLSLIFHLVNVHVHTFYSACESQITEENMTKLRTVAKEETLAHLLCSRDVIMTLEAIICSFIMEKLTLSSDSEQSFLLHDDECVASRLACALQLSISDLCSDWQWHVLHMFARLNAALMSRAELKSRITEAASTLSMALVGFELPVDGQEKSMRAILEKACALKRIAAN